MLHKYVEGNLGRIDKAFRAIMGIAIILVGTHYRSWVIVIGIFLLVTAIIGYCPMYSILNISTCGRKRHRRKHSPITHQHLHKDKEDHARS
jgi:hypothetical protein